MLFGCFRFGTVRAAHGWQQDSMADMRQSLLRFGNLVIDQQLAKAEAVSGTLAPISKGAANGISWADGVGSETCILKHFENTLDKNDHGAIESKLKSISAVLGLDLHFGCQPLSETTKLEPHHSSNKDGNSSNNTAISAFRAWYKGTAATRSDGR
jgi:hypothetical protein